jgi:hypothetical protein
MTSSGAAVDAVGRQIASLGAYLTRFQTRLF